MLTTYHDLKAALLADPESLVLIAAFFGATCHIIWTWDKLIPATRGIGGALIGVTIGVIGTLMARWMMDWKLADIWFFGFPLAFMANYFIGGMESIGKQIAEDPLKMLIAFVTQLIDGVLNKIAEYKLPKK